MPFPTRTRCLRRRDGHFRRDAKSPAVWRVLFALLAVALLPSSDSLVVHVEKRAARLAIVIPYLQRDAQHVLANLALWPAEGDPCPVLRAYEAKHFVDLVFWYNLDLDANQTF